MIKRLFDSVGSLMGLVILSPLFVAVALWIKMDSSGPVFFRQKRVGRYGGLFDILKFRTMIANAEELGPSITADGDQRITKSGLFLRKHKLDELPQLINVLKGDMSLVGPRPEVPEYVAFYPDGLREKILSVRPGITDLASLEFRDESAILADSQEPVLQYVEEILPRKLRYYALYVDEQNLWLDAKIIVRTLLVLSGSFINKLRLSFSKRLKDKRRLRF
jgi:lipopolysaccharide/colanic/teichoic acid biosynthesis glycosyltransferase